MGHRRNPYFLLQKFSASDEYCWFWPSDPIPTKSRRFMKSRTFASVKDVNTHTVLGLDALFNCLCILLIIRIRSGRSRTRFNTTEESSSLSKCIERHPKKGKLSLQTGDDEAGNRERNVKARDHLKIYSFTHLFICSFAILYYRKRWYFDTLPISFRKLTIYIKNIQTAYENKHFIVTLSSWR